MKKLVLYIFLLLTVLQLIPKGNEALKAQDIGFSQYIYSPVITNPGMLNFARTVNIGMLYRYQPLDAGNNFSTSLLTASYPFYEKTKQRPWGKLGVSFVNENLSDVFRTNGGLVSFAYNLNLGKSMLSFGMNAGFFQSVIGLNPANVTLDKQFETGVFNPGEINESFENLSVLFPVVSSGLVWYKQDALYRNKWFLGVSWLNMNQPKIAFLNEGRNIPLHFTAIGGFRLYERSRFSLMPNFKMTRRLDKIFTNFGSWFNYDLQGGKRDFIKNGQLNAGLWYNTNKALTSSVEIHQPGYFLAFSYDLPIATNSSSWLGNGAVEFTFGVKINRKLKKTTIVQDTTNNNQLLVKIDTTTRPKDENLLVSRIDIEPIKRQDIVIYPKKDTITLEIKGSDTLILAQVTTYSEEEIDTTEIKRIHKLDFQLIPSDKAIFDNQVIFNFSSLDIDEDYGRYLNKVADILKRNKPVHLKIIGHTCDVGTEFRNIKLSEDRAKSVKDYLVRQGIEASRINTEGVGSNFPLVPNNNEENRRRNRRVEFKISLN